MAEKTNDKAPEGELVEQLRALGDDFQTRLSRITHRACWLAYHTPEIIAALSRPAVDVDAATLARIFHDAYERLASSFNYETRQETRAFDPDSPNGRLMIATCEEVRRHLSPNGAEPVNRCVSCREELMSLLCRECYGKRALAGEEE